MKGEISHRRTTGTKAKTSFSTRIHEETCEPLQTFLVQESMNEKANMTIPDETSPCSNSAQVPNEDQANFSILSRSKDPKNINE